MGLTIFAQRLRQAREAKGLKQNELAKLASVTPATISSYEKSDTEGNGKKTTLENALAIAKNLNVSLDWLSGLSDIASKSFTDFKSEDYFKSLATVLMEKGTHLISGAGITNTCICVYSNIPDSADHARDYIQEFVKRANDLIQIYHAGALPPDMLDVCLNKLLSDYSGKYNVNFGALTAKEE